MAHAVLRNLSALPDAAAHVVCVGLFGADLWSRTARVQLMVRGAGSDLTFRQALALTSFGDAASAVTPWRAGGEVARVLGARGSGVTLPLVAAALSVETVISYALAAVVGVWLTAEYGGEWLDMMRARGTPGISARLLWLVAASVAGLLVLCVAIPALRRRLTAALGGVGTAVRAARRIPSRALFACLLLSVISLVARVGILPVLALTLDARPSLGVLALVSFTLIHGQIAMPTPAGAGPIEYAFMKGAAGAGAATGAMLASWRLYATMLPVVAGFFIGALAYGRQVWSGAWGVWSRMWAVRSGIGGLGLEVGKASSQAPQKPKQRLQGDDNA